MHHSHAKRKEKTMRANPSQPIRIDPEVVAVLQASARRARSQAMYNLAVRLVHKLTPRINFRQMGTHWG
jgi:hypothetical protein